MLLEFLATATVYLVPCIYLDGEYKDRYVLISIYPNGPDIYIYPNGPDDLSIITSWLFGDTRRVIFQVTNMIVARFHLEFSHY